MKALKQTKKASLATDTVDEIYGLSEDEVAVVEGRE